MVYLALVVCVDLDVVGTVVARVVVKWPVLVVNELDGPGLLEVCVDRDVAGTVVARVVVRWPVLVVYEPDDPRLLVVYPVVVVCDSTDVTGMVVE